MISSLITYINGYVFDFKHCNSTRWHKHFGLLLLKFQKPMNKVVHGSNLIALTDEFYFLMLIANMHALIANK